MARDVITVHKPNLEDSKSIASAVIKKQTVNVANGIEIKNALDNKNNSLFITVECTTAGKVIFVAGDNYPNAILGDLDFTPSVGVNIFQLQDISRFENRDGSVYLNFGSGFAGSVYAMAKRAGLQ